MLSLRVIVEGNRGKDKKELMLAGTIHGTVHGTIHGTVHRVLFMVTVHQKKTVLRVTVHVDTNIGDTDVKDKQEVKKADEQEIKNIKDEEGKIVEDQQVFEMDDDTNNDDFGCSLPPHKGVDLTVEKVEYNKADGKWEPARRKEDGNVAVSYMDEGCQMMMPVYGGLSLS
nr:hypothetical protein [Tanacetum cinerariifolium]